MGHIPRAFASIMWRRISSMVFARKQSPISRQVARQRVFPLVKNRSDIGRVQGKRIMAVTMPLYCMLICGGGALSRGSCSRKRLACMAK